jgi:uncharacterized SAM-binding protein YcdF (DUF218 family)
LILQLRLVLTASGAMLCLLASGIVARQLAPTSNTDLTRFDAIIVLGSPANSDGNPTPVQLSRVTEAVHEYERGVAPRLILTGGATRNGFVEAKVMARSAQAQGIPESSIFIEPEARDTIQNACYSLRILKAHGWSSAEVISSAAHVPRVGMVLSHLPLDWRIHTAQPITPTSAFSADTDAVIESLKTARYLVWSRWAERCMP